MGMDLDGACGYFRWSNAGWADILELGQAYGWIPTGTGPPRGERKAEWGEGSYFGNDAQLFYARDARALADALERALASLSAGESPPRTRPAQATDYLEAVLTGASPEEGRVPVRKVDAEKAAYIREFIEFCRAGSFRIY
jgi:hypothetical protein